MVSACLWLIYQCSHLLPQNVIDFKGGVDGCLPIAYCILNTGSGIKRVGIVLLQSEVWNYLGFLIFLYSDGRRACNHRDA